MQQIVTQLAEHIKKFNDLSQTPIVLTSQVIRIYLSRMLAQFYPNLYVLAFNETLQMGVGKDIGYSLLHHLRRGPLEVFHQLDDRTPPRRFCEHGQLRVVTLDAEVEKRVISSLSKNEQGIYLAMGLRPA